MCSCINQCTTILKGKTHGGNTDMVPPAFTEVWKLMFQCVFNHFKHDTDHSAQPPVTQNQRLQSRHTFLNTTLYFNYLQELS